MSASAGEVRTRFCEHARAAGLADGTTVVVAVSGGVDSVSLLHLLRFSRDLPRLRLVAAHLDHAMRPGSAGDARWCRGLTRAWAVPLRETRLDPPADGEDDARRRRYKFLEEVRRTEDAGVVVTAHHADDQVETVLFRALRGTGLGGLAGIREHRGPAIWRPMLLLGRADVLAYAAGVDLSWREDPTNMHPFARNVLRHSALPLIEATVAPGARKALLGLARLARENEEAWRSLEPQLFAQLALGAAEGELSVDREALLALHPGIRARLVRTLATRLGGAPGSGGTRAALEFLTSGASGGAVPLASDVALRRDLDRITVFRTGHATVDEPVSIGGLGAGEARARVGGRPYVVSWAGSRRAHGVSEGFDAAYLRFPIAVRGWSPGDRARLGYGSKKLKKIFLEARVPSEERHRVPVVVDAAGAVLWVPGVIRSAEVAPAGEGEALFIGIRDDESA